MAVKPARTIHVTETGSTNGDAMARALSGEALPFWLAADRQTAGRGRSGRVWVSEPGNLHASLALRLSCGPAVAAQLSLVAGLAVIDAIGAAVHRAGTKPAERFQLKWPNDVLNGTAKCGGILIETASARRGLVAVIGIGLNLACQPATEGRSVSSLAACRVVVSPKSMLATIAEAMDSRLVLWNEGGGFAAVREAWLAASLPVGTAMTVNTGAALATGTFAGLDTDGALLLATAGGNRERFTFGDVTLAS